MRIRTGLLGLGKTGSVVAESLFRDRRFDLVFVAKNKLVEACEFNFVVEPKELIEDLMNRFRPEVVIDFTTPQAVMTNIKKLPEETGYVIATTGFTELQISRMKKYKHLKILYAPNISDGINVLIRSCELFNRIWSNADVEIVEQHFREKKDSPSGTAKKIARVIDGKIPIHSVRVGGVVGVHEVILATANQKITLRHESFSKKVFAEGAKRAAIWLRDKECGFYDISEVYR